MTRKRIMLIATVAACAIAPLRPYAHPPTRPSGQFTLGMSQCNLGEPWRVQMNKDLAAAAKNHPELTVKYVDAQNKSTTQQDQVRQFIQQKVDVIIISPKEAKPLTAPVAEAMKAKIPVIVLDRKVEGDKYTCFIGADNVKIGVEAGKYLVKLLGGKGNVVELKGLMTSTPGQERHKGFLEGLTAIAALPKGPSGPSRPSMPSMPTLPSGQVWAYPQIKIVAEADCQWLEPNAQNEMRSILSRFPQIDAVYAHNDPAAHGAYIAAKQEGKGREKRIKFIGIDALPHEGVKYVKDGLLAATFEYPTGGREAIDIALQILKGEKVAKNITLGTRVFTKATPDGKAL